MKKLMIALIAISLTGCGVVQELENERERLEAEVEELRKDLIECNELFLEMAEQEIKRGEK